jgi:hypothetical protein
LRIARLLYERSKKCLVNPHVSDPCLNLSLSPAQADRDDDEGAAAAAGSSSPARLEATRRRRRDDASSARGRRRDDEDSEGSGEDLFENAEEDYKEIGMLDEYDENLLDRRDDLGEIDFDERQRAEEEMAERDRREGRFVRRGQLGAAMESEDGESTPARPALAAT